MTDEQDRASVSLCSGLDCGCLAGVALGSPPRGARSPLIEKIVSEVSEERLGEILRKLEGFGTRYSFSNTRSETSGIGAARRFLKSWLEREAPRLEVRFDPYQVKKQGGRLIGTWSWSTWWPRTEAATPIAGSWSPGTTTPWPVRWARARMTIARRRE
jgi:hypothetical protein